MNDAYAAGLIDGEGYIRIRQAGTSYQVQLKIGMTDRGLPALKRMQRLYGGAIDNEKRSRGNQRPDVYTWRMNGSAASGVIRKVQPFLTIKAAQAEIALSLQDMIDSADRRGNRQAVWTEDMRSRAALMDERMRWENRRGRETPLPNLPIVAQYSGGAWWEPNDGLFGPIRFEGNFPKHGRMVKGRIYELPAPLLPM